MVTFSCELRYDGVGFKAYLLDAQDFNDLEKVAGVKHYTLLLPLKGVQSRAPFARQLHLALLDVSRDAQEQERGTR